MSILARLAAGPSTIAYLGTSVTIQRDGFRPRLHARLCERTGHEHRSVLAGMGGAGSLAGAFLVDELALPQRPDVCFIEYGTVDAAGATPIADVEPALEGIVRKLLANACEPCLLLLPRDLDGTPGLELPSWVVQATTAVASRHDVPLVRADRISSPTPVLRDEVHTSTAGAVAISDWILAALASTAPPRARRGPVDTSSPAITDTRIVAAEPGWFRHPARVETGRLHLVRSYVRAACENPLTWTFDGELVGMLVVLGPESGHVRVRAGGREEDVALWDVDCHYQRMNVVLLRRRVPADAAMTLELIDRPVDRSACKRPLPDDLETDLRLIGFLVYG